MSYVWFEMVLEALGKRISFESISNLYGNSFAKDASKYISAANPLVKNGGKSVSSGIESLAGAITIVDSKKTQDSDGGLDFKELNKMLGGGSSIDWIGADALDIKITDKTHS